MNDLAIYDALAADGLPIPVTLCGNCQGTIWRKGTWFQCPDCGALSTEYGGLFTHSGINAKWAAECVAARMRLNDHAEHTTDVLTSAGLK